MASGTRGRTPRPTVAKLCEAFDNDAARKLSREVHNFRLELRALLTLHRDTATERFTFNDLIAVQEALIDGGHGYQTGRPGRRAGGQWSEAKRTYINA